MQNKTCGYKEWYFNADQLKPRLTPPVDIVQHGACGKEKERGNVESQGQSINGGVWR